MIYYYSCTALASAAQLRHASWSRTLHQCWSNCQPTVKFTVLYKVVDQLAHGTHVKLYKGQACEWTPAFIVPRRLISLIVHWKAGQTQPSSPRVAQLVQGNSSSQDSPSWEQYPGSKVQVPCLKWYTVFNDFQLIHKLYEHAPNCHENAPTKHCQHNSLPHPGPTHCVCGSLCHCLYCPQFSSKELRHLSVFAVGLWG